MRSMRRLTALVLAMMMVIPNTGNIMLGAATAKATTLRLEQTEGTATLKNANGIAKTIKAGMKLYNGDDVTTDKSSYAYISLDGTKAVKMDESSSVSIKQSGTQNEVMVNSGSLIFNVTVPLTKKESLNIRTSTMVTGVRGTIGYAKKISEEESEIAILEGKVELTSIDSKTGKSRSVFISAGEKGVCRRVKAKFEKNSDLQVPQVKAEKITEDDIPDFAVIEIGRNLDIQERLRKDGVFDVEKILARYRTLGDKGTFITIGTPVTPNSVSANKPVTPNTVSNNEAGGGGGGGGGAGGGGGGGSVPSPAAAPSITLATVNGGGVYAEGEPIGALSVTAEVDKAGAYTTYQWYVANSADGAGTAVNGATDTTYTPDSVLGTRYFYCVVRSKESSSSTAESLKETNRVVVAVKQPSTKVTEALSQPGDANIGFTSITLNPVSLASVGSIDGSINEAGSKIKLTGVSHSAQASESLRAETVVFNAPVSNTSSVEGEVEYAKSTTATAPTDDDEWQTDRTFNGLAMGTPYYFFARASATGSTFAGAPSDPIEIWTKAGNAVRDYTDSTNHLYYTFDLTGYDGTVSPNAIVQGESGLTLDVGSITIPESIRVYDMDIKVTEIYGFSDNAGCGSLSFSKVVIPDTIEKIDYGAFYHRELTSVTIPDSVIEIGDSAFHSCTSLQMVHFGKNLKKIGNSAFYGCSSLNNVVLGDNVETIGGQAFFSCWGLSNITLNEGLKYIGESAFVNCPFSEITFPSTITAVSGNDGNSNSPFYMAYESAGVAAIYYARSSALDSWLDGWNKKRLIERDPDSNIITNMSDETIPVYYYEEDPNDPSVVRVYSPEAKVSNYSGGVQNAEVAATGLAFPDSSTSTNNNTYSGFIDSRFLKKMFSIYDTVIIPEQNIAILDEDLTIPAGKTLDIKGDMSTENFDEVMDGSMSYVQENTAYGNLTNYGTVLIKGNLFTSNQQMVITDTTVADHEDKMSSTIISSGKMVVSGKVTIFYSTYNQQTNPNTDYSGFSGLDCSDLTITSSGIVEINGLNGSLNHGVNFTPDSIAGMTGEQFNNSDQTILRKAADADSTGSFKLKFEHFYNNTEEHFRVQILDSTETYTGVVYDEH